MVGADDDLGGAGVAGDEVELVGEASTDACGAERRADMDECEWRDLGAVVGHDHSDTDQPPSERVPSAIPPASTYFSRACRCAATECPWEPLGSQPGEFQELGGVADINRQERIDVRRHGTAAPVCDIPATRGAESGQRDPTGGQSGYVVPSTPHAWVSRGRTVSRYPSQSRVVANDAIIRVANRYC